MNFNNYYCQQFFRKNTSVSGKINQCTMVHCIFYMHSLQQIISQPGVIAPLDSGTSRLEKRGLSLNGSFWFHFSAEHYIFSED